MPGRSKVPGVDPFLDLEKKVEVLQRELSMQRDALERLKQMGKADPARPRARAETVRESA